MFKLKQIHLQNFCGYRDSVFDFVHDGKVQSLSLFYGPNGIGKCLAGTEYIVTEKGMILIKDLFKDISLKEDTWYNKKFKISVNGELKQVKNIYYNGQNKTVSIKTKRGYSLEGSYDNHEVLAVRNGKVEFVLMRELVIGDIVCLSRKSVFPKTSNLRDSQASILGYMVAEGVVSKNKKAFFNSDDEVLEDFVSNFKNGFGDCKIQRFNSSPGIGQVYVSTKFWKQLLDLGLKDQTSVNKTVPESVLMGSKNNVISFLRSYFEGDGGIDGNGVSCSSISKELIKQIQLLLLRLGILSSISSKKSKLNYTDKYQDRYKSWKLRICGKDVLLFDKQIGFVSSRKKQKIKHLVDTLSRKSRNPNIDVIPKALFKSLALRLKNEIKKLPARSSRGAYFSRQDYKATCNGLHCLQDNYIDIVVKGVSSEKVDACIKTISEASGRNIKKELEKSVSWFKEEYFFEEITDVSNGFCELFDVCVEDVHCFWSNGFINHNSTVLDAARILSSPWRYSSRNVVALFRKSVFNKDYDPIYGAYASNAEDIMALEGIFTSPDGDKKVRFEYDPVKAKLIEEDEMDFREVGVKINELPQGQPDYAYFVDADNPINMGKFNLAKESEDVFLDIAKTVYGYDCWLDKEIDEKDHVTGDVYTFYADFIIYKPKEDVKVHYKRMSAGERKIATMLADLCSPVKRKEYDIFLIDNIEMHVYFKRHLPMMDKIREHFGDKQILATTHSGVIIESPETPKHELFDIEEYK